MSKLDKHTGLMEAHSILRDYFIELHDEHKRTEPTFFGIASRRQRELAAMGDAMAELGKRLVAHGAKIVAEGKVAA